MVEVIFLILLLLPSAPLMLPMWMSLPKTLYLVEPTMPPHLHWQVLSLTVHMHLLKVVHSVQ
jgi:hypothetical protein